MNAAYYNEIDPTAAHVLRHLIATNVIAPGDVDTRSIKDVKPDDLKGYTQCHFFAGGGLWSIAARLAGWPDDRPLWTGSCPCQPFSQAGQGRGIDDERHLWPDFHRLIAARRPSVVVGEQVAGKAGYGWLDGVRTDLGAEGYASGAVDIPAAAMDAPQIRQRLYWVALAGSENVNRGSRPGEPRRQEPANLFGTGVTQGDAFEPRLEGHAGDDNAEIGRALTAGSVAETNGGDVAFTSGEQQGWRRRSHEGTDRDDAGERAEHQAARSARASGVSGSFWSYREWITCHDNKARRTKPGLRLLVDGLPGRVGLWRIAGNAIVAPLAAEVLKALSETLPHINRPALGGRCADQQSA